jgi:hypothetical protein
MDLGRLQRICRKAPGRSIRNRAARTPWLSGHDLQATEQEIRVFSKPATWRTQEAALANATTGSFCLSTTQKVGFRVHDTQFGDNQAGMSLKVSNACASCP